MKNKLFVILVLTVLLLPEKVTAQDDYEDKYASRYRLDLPEEWINKPRILKAITNILPQKLSQIKDFDFCTEGKARYVVELLLGKPMIKGEVTTHPVEMLNKISYTHSFEYSFFAAFLLFDTTGKALSLVMLNSSKEAYSYQKEYSFNSGNQRYTDGNTTFNPEAGTAHMTDLRIARQMAKQPVNEFTALAILNDDFLLKICEVKIFEIQKKIMPTDLTQ